MKSGNVTHLDGAEVEEAEHSREAGAGNHVATSLEVLCHTVLICSHCHVTDVRVNGRYHLRGTVQGLGCRV